MIQVIVKDIGVTDFENTCNAVTVIFLELVFSTAFQIFLYKGVYIDHTYCWEMPA